MEDADKLEEEIKREIEALKNFQELADSIKKALAEKDKETKKQTDLKNTENSF